MWMGNLPSKFQWIKVLFLFLFRYVPQDIVKKNSMGPLPLKQKKIVMNLDENAVVGYGSVKSEPDRCSCFQ